MAELLLGRSAALALAFRFALAFCLTRRSCVCLVGWLGVWRSFRTSWLGVIGYIPSAALELDSRSVQQAFNLASALRACRIRSRDTLNLLETMLTLLTLELVKRHSSPSMGIPIAILEAFSQTRQKASPTRFRIALSRYGQDRGGSEAFVFRQRVPAFRAV